MPAAAGVLHRIAHQIDGGQQNGGIVAVERAGSHQLAQTPRRRPYSSPRPAGPLPPRPEAPQGHNWLANIANNIQQAGHLERLNDDKRHNHVRQQAGGGDGKASAGAIDKHVHDILRGWAIIFSS